MKQKGLTKQLIKWTGEFGRAYAQRNALSLMELDKIYKKNYGITRTELNEVFLAGISRSSRILEIGSNVGNQLLILQKLGFKNLYGLEPLEYAVELSKKRTHHINIIKGDAFDIPFKDKYFDIVFTSGVLIHINPADIKKALPEIYRCSRRYIWGFEYYAKSCEEIIYRGNKDLLWKNDFVRQYLKFSPDLKVVKRKKLKYLKDRNIDEMFLLKKS